MIGETSTTSVVSPPETKTSVLITISTPGTDTPICRLSNSDDILKDLTVKQLIQRIISPNSLFSVGVPLSQLQAESPAALAIGELLAADCCQVVTPSKGASPEQIVSLDQPVCAIVREQQGAQGNRFINVQLEVRSVPDAAAPAGDERRQVSTPSTLEMAGEESSTPSAATPVCSLSTSAPTTESSFITQSKPFENTAFSPHEELSPVFPTKNEAENSMVSEQTPPAISSASTNGIITIVAEKVKDEPKEGAKEKKEYVRKSDWLRAQFLPEVESLDFSGLFVGNLGLGIREEKARRNVVLADPSRITEVLLRANGYRRTGDHAKALICYQELVDMDSSNADFRFLLGKTLLALGQQEQAIEAFMRAKELGHEGAEKEIADLKRTGHRPRTSLGFLRFWKQ